MNVYHNLQAEPQAVGREWQVLHDALWLELVGWGMLCGWQRCDRGYLSSRVRLMTAYNAATGGLSKVILQRTQSASRHCSLVDCWLQLA